MLALLPHIFPQLDNSQGGFRWGADAMAFSLVDSLRLRLHEHTIVAFIDIKKAFDSCWVEATLVRLFDFSVTGSLWHLLANFLCGTLSQVRLGGSVSSRWVDSGIAQGRIISLLLFNLLIDSLAITLRCAISGVSLATDSFRHACQLYADDLVVLTASPQGWFNVIRFPRPPSVPWPNARQPDGVRSSAASSQVRPQFTSAQGRWRQERSKVSPEVVMENARKKVSGPEAAIAAMTASGMDENSPEVTTLKGSLAKAKRNAQEAPIAVQVKGAQEFVDRAQKRLDAHDKLRKELEVELVEGQARLQRLR